VIGTLNIVVDLWITRSRRVAALPKCSPGAATAVVLLAIGGKRPASMKELLIVVLAGLLVWVSSALIRVENERYALSLGMCPDAYEAGMKAHFDCIDTVETRTHPMWHLVYALGIF
jgi:hypothetical protein